MINLALQIKSLGEDMNKLTESEIAWLAGIYEGEGCCKISSGRAIGVEIVMTDEDIIQRLHELTGVGYVHTLAQRNEKYKQVYKWNVGSADAVEFLTTILPWLGKRRSIRAKNAITNWQTNRKQSTAGDISCVNGHRYDTPGNRRTKYGTCHLCNLEASRRYRERIASQPQPME
jgi:hypothetical protein